jgi:hypothetical protein
MERFIVEESDSFMAESVLGSLEPGQIKWPRSGRSRWAEAGRNPDVYW